MDLDGNSEAGPSRPRRPLSPDALSNSSKRFKSDLQPETYDPNQHRLRGGGKPRSKRPQRSSRPTTTTEDGDAEPRPARSSRKPGATNGRKRVTRAQARKASSSSPTTDLETIAAEDAAVKGEIARLGLSLRDVQGDGNCLFRAVADQLWGVQKRHPEVRKLVCDYLETHKDGMEAFVTPFMKDGETYESYVERMRQLTQFASHIEIQAAARVFRRSIRVIMSTTSFTIPWESETDSLPHTPAPLPTPDVNDPNHPRLRTRSSTLNLLSTPALPPPSSPSYAKSLAEYIPPVRTGRSMLWLALFSQAEHFQSVRKKGDGDSGPAEIEDKLAIPHLKDLSEAARRQRGELPVEESGKSGSAGANSGSQVSQVLASLPPGHGVTEKQASGILARVKGDLGEAVEILLEELRLEGTSDETDDTAVNPSGDDGNLKKPDDTQALAIVNGDITDDDATVSLDAVSDRFDEFEPEFTPITPTPSKSYAKRDKQFSQPRLHHYNHVTPTKPPMASFDEPIRHTLRSDKSTKSSSRPSVRRGNGSRDSGMIANRGRRTVAVV